MRTTSKVLYDMADSLRAMCLPIGLNMNANGTRITNLAGNIDHSNRLTNREALEYMNGMRTAAVLLYDGITVARQLINYTTNQYNEVPDELKAAGRLATEFLDRLQCPAKAPRKKLMYMVDADDGEYFAARVVDEFFVTVYSVKSDEDEPQHDLPEQLQGIMKDRTDVNGLLMFLKKIHQVDALATIQIMK